MPSAKQGPSMERGESSAVSGLTAAQRQFAQVVGQALADRWLTEQGGHARGQCRPRSLGEDHGDKVVLNSARRGP